MNRKPNPIAAATGKKGAGRGGEKLCGGRTKGKARPWAEGIGRARKGERRGWELNNRRGERGVALGGRKGQAGRQVAVDALNLRSSTPCVCAVERWSGGED
jgi:hypothetical protein